MFLLDDSAWSIGGNDRSKQLIKVVLTSSCTGAGIARLASRQVRGRMPGLLPKWSVEDARRRCKETIAASTVESTRCRLRKTQSSFLKHGVNIGSFERYSGHRIEETSVDELVEWVDIFHALKDGASAVDFSGVVEAERDPQETTTAFTEIAYASSVRKSALNHRVAKSAAAVFTTAEKDPQETSDKIISVEETLQAENSRPIRVEQHDPQFHGVAETDQTLDGETLERAETLDLVVVPQDYDVFLT
jgi:hypothetical protein